jgi:plastocyanin
MSPRIPCLALAALLLVPVLAAPASAAPAKGAVNVLDNRFDPKLTSIYVGEKVTWTFKGAVKHNVTGTGFASKVMKSGTFTHTYNSAGTFEYHCSIHPGMKAKVKVS